MFADTEKAESCPSAASDPRVARLSPPARDLLERILRKFPHKDLFSDDWRVPAAPAHLRQTCFNCDDPLLDSHIGRQLQELELNSIVILRRVRGRIRSLRLCLDFTSAPVAPQVIHNSRDGPAERDKQIIAVAAATTDSVLLIEKLKPLFPLHDVAAEFDRYFAHRKKIGRPATGSPFAKWMLRAEVPLKRLSDKAVKRPAPTPASTLQPFNDSTSEAQPDLFEEVDRKRFVEQYAERKARKTNK